MALKKIPDNPTKDLHFTKGDKEVLSVRLPSELIKTIEIAAKEHGWPKSDFVQFAMDQYLVHLGYGKK